MMIEKAPKAATPLKEILNEVSKNSSNVCANFPNGKELAIWKSKGFWWCQRELNDPEGNTIDEIYAKTTEDCINRIQKEYYEQ